MRLLIADKLPASAVESLKNKGFEVDMDPSLNGDALRLRLAESGPEVLVVRSTKVTDEMLDASSQLGLIVRGGAGVNTIAVAGAAKRGIYVANCPGKNAAAVAELAFGLILSADRQIPNNVRDLRAGKWAKKTYAKSRGLKGRTLGLVGLGNIGREMIPRAHGFGMRVVAWSRSLTDDAADELGITRAESPVDVARQADAVSVHVAMCDDTSGLVDDAFVEAMKPGAIFVNTSRGGVVDEEALARGLAEKDLRVGLDVYLNEPTATDPGFDTPLAQHERLFGTHHIGASTAQAQEAVADEVVRIILSYRDSGEVPNCVNLCEHSPATHMLIVRHRDEVGVLAGIFDALRAANINTQETQNTIFDGAHAAIARIRLDKAPDDGVLADMRASGDVLAIHLVPLD